MAPDLRYRQLQALLGHGAEAGALPISEGDAPAVASYALEQGLGPLAYVAARERDDVSADVKAFLERTYLETAKQNVLLFHELELAATALAEAGTPFLALKGAALAQMLYGNVALRPLRDLDLLVRPADVAGALEALGKLGYVREGLDVRSDIALGYENELLLRRRRSGRLETPLELHWHLFDVTFYQERVSPEWFWETAQATAIDETGRRRLMTPGATAQVLYLCAHLALHHQGKGLIWLVDIARLLTLCEQEIVWPELLAQAQAYQMVLPLQTVLPRSLEWGGRVPEAVLQELAALEPSDEEAHFFAAMNATARPVAQRFYTDLRGIVGGRRRLRFAMAQLFPSRDYMAARYRLKRPALAPLYYPYRWLIGLKEAAAVFGKGEGV